MNYLRFSWFIYVYIELLKLFGDVQVELYEYSTHDSSCFPFLGDGKMKCKSSHEDWMDQLTHASRRSLENRSFAHFTYLECWISSQPVGVNGLFRVSHQFLVDANRIRYT